MNRIKELEYLIEKMRVQLTDFLDTGVSFDKIYKLSDEIDQLIVEHHNLLKSKK